MTHYASRTMCRLKGEFFLSVPPPPPPHGIRHLDGWVWGWVGGSAKSWGGGQFKPPPPQVSLSYGLTQSAHILGHFGPFFSCFSDICWCYR